MKDDNPSHRSSAYQEQLADLQIVNDCYEGTRAIKDRARSSGTVRLRYDCDYLPQEPAEKEKNYLNRLRKSVFWNAFSRTVSGLTGMVFRKDPILGDDIPVQIKTHLENVDLEGSHFDVFAKEVFSKALIDGHTFILVEMPPPITAENPTATLANERAEGRRPYWIHYNKDQVINWRDENVNGARMLTQVTIRETHCEPAGTYTDQMVTKYRVLRPGSWQLFRKEANQDEPVLEAEGLTSLDVIPLVTIYTRRKAYMRSSPPLLDLALENLRHFRLQSDLDNILHVANVPILTAIGRSDTKKPIEVGGNTVVDVPMGGKLEYTEHHGEAVKGAQEEIERCKRNMATLGLALIAIRQVQATATESILDFESESCELADMARNAQDGFEMALIFHAKYIGESQGGSIEIHRDFVKVALDAQKLSALSTMEEKDQLSIETLWSIMERAEELPEDFVAEEEKERIEEERSKRAAAGADLIRGFDLAQPEILPKQTQPKEVPTVQ